MTEGAEFDSRVRRGTAGRDSACSGSGPSMETLPLDGSRSPLREALQRNKTTKSLKIIFNRGVLLDLLRFLMRRTAATSPQSIRMDSRIGTITLAFA